MATRVSVASPMRSAQAYKAAVRPRRLYSKSTHGPTVAVLFQDIEPPVIGGVRKPRKPGGTYKIYIS